MDSRWTFQLQPWPCLVMSEPHLIHAIRRSIKIRSGRYFSCNQLPRLTIRGKISFINNEKMLGYCVYNKNNTPYSTVMLIWSFVFYCRSSYDNINAYMLRSMIGQALLQTIGGSTKFSVSKLDATRLYNIQMFKFPNWNCNKTYKHDNNWSKNHF